MMESLNQTDSQTKPTVYSSFLFFINSLVAFLYKFYLYSALFFMLASTSLVVHSTDNIYANYLDKIAVYSIVFYGGYLFFTKLMKIKNQTEYIVSTLIVTTFLYVVYLYHYGYSCNKYCFCDDKSVANLYHSLMHVVGSIGHLLIIIL